MFFLANPNNRVGKILTGTNYRNDAIKAQIRALTLKAPDTFRFLCNSLPKWRLRCVLIEMYEPSRGFQGCRLLYCVTI